MCLSKKLSVFLMFVICLSLFFSGCVENKTPEEKLDKYMKKICNKYNSPTSGISVLVAEDGKILYKKSYGYSNIETMEKADSNTNYRLASVTKMFTSMCIMILKDRGQLDYDTKVSDILEDFPEYGKEITVRHLLNHTSGLKDFYELVDLLDEEFNEENQILDSDVYEIVKRANSTYFEPGLKFKYSDTGYIVLGLIVEKVSGMSLSLFMEENIFIPLHMDNTIAVDKRVPFKIKNRAYGTQYKVNKFITTDQSYSSATLGDGGIYSSVDDLYKWDQALYDGLERDVLVRKETLQEAYTPPKPLNKLCDNYTFGWFFRNNAEGELEQRHAGRTQGFSSYYIRMPKKKKTFIFLSNKDCDDNLYEIEEVVRDLYGFGEHGIMW